MGQDGEYQRQPVILGSSIPAKKNLVSWPTVIPIVIALLAAIFTGWQAAIAERTRQDAVEAARRQDLKDKNEISRQDRKEREQERRQQLKDEDQARAQDIKDRVAADALKKTLMNSDRSARAAEKSAGISQRSQAMEFMFFKLQNRSRLALMSAIVADGVKLGYETKVHFNFANHSSQIALNVVNCGGAAVVYDMIHSPKEKNFSMEPPSQPSTIAAFSERGATSTNRLLTLTELMGVFTHHVRLFFLETVTYTDDTTHDVHHLKWCGYFDPDKPLEPMAADTDCVSQND